MSRFIPVDPEKWAAMVIAQSDLVRYKEICDELDAECTRLQAEVERLTDLKAESDRFKAEVERLTAFTTRTIIPNEELQKQVERLTKAGDAMAEELNGRYFGKRLINDWNAAKEGKQP
jgi:DNA repair ATPase RecN